MTSEMELVVDAGGSVRCIYDEALDLRELGKLQITRASHVEPDAAGYWWADMRPVVGPVMGPFGTRSEALAAERAWLVGSVTCQGEDDTESNNLRLTDSHAEPPSEPATATYSLGDKQGLKRELDRSFR
jgi:hypothetical protein